MYIEGLLATQIETISNLPTISNPLMIRKLRLIVNIYITSESHSHTWYVINSFSGIILILFSYVILLYI